ncbi:MAG TPA: hypothetical protein VFA18_03245, partial [Gemmataceae bacterium]|nr:hypothetical protein [Gemmataceae bacterium]
DIRGEVVGQGNRARSGARVLFVSVALHGPQEAVAVDAAGKFHVSLAAGSWLVYVKDANAKPVFYRRIEVKDNENRSFRLVSR